VDESESRLAKRLEEQEGLIVNKKDVSKILKPILEKDEHIEMQQGRTLAGLCARCAESPVEHENGKCPDDKGSFTWAHTREDMRQLIRGLEGFLDEARKTATKPPVTLETVTDADRVCSIMYCASAGKLPTWAPSEPAYLTALAAASEQTVDKDGALKLLKSLLAVGPRVLPNLNFPRVIGELCGWPHARTMIAIESARDAGYISGGKPLAKS